jgi:hypothetical protein
MDNNNRSPSTYGGFMLCLRNFPLSLVMLAAMMLSLSCNKNSTGSDNSTNPSTELTGDTVWTRAFGTSGNESAFGALETADHGFLIAGGYYSDHQQPYLVKTNAAGTEEWHRVLNDTVSLYAVASCADGGYIFIGHDGLGTSNLIKTDGQGIQLWKKSFALSDPWDIEVMSDGGFAFGGTMFASMSENGPALLRTNASGDTLWTRFLSPGSSARMVALESSGDGGLVCALGPGRLVKVDANGTQLWAEDYADMVVNGMCRAQNGDFLLSGESDGQLVLKRVNSGGTAIWTHSYGGSGGDSGYQIVQTADGGFAVAGETSSFGQGIPGYSNMWVVKIAANGDSSWAKVFGGENHDSGWGIIKTHDNRLLIVGETDSYGNGSFDMYAVLLK